MSAAQQAKARRREMRNNYDHLPPRMRPYYKKRDMETARRHQERLDATAKRMMQGSKKKK